MPVPGHKLLARYFILTYVIFLILLGITGFFISLNVPVPVQIIMKNLCAWAPTISLILLYRKIYNGLKVKDYLRHHFLSRINLKVFLLVTLFQTGIFFISILCFAIKRQIALSAVPFQGLSATMLAFIINVTSGPLGEELGWRGYALNELQKKFTPFRSAMIIGIIWGLWHAPLWFLTGYSGVKLMQYVGLFLTGIVSLSVVITLFYNQQKNILVPIWIHFLFNFFLQLPKVELPSLLTYYVACYVIFAAILLFRERKTAFIIVA